MTWRAAKALLTLKAEVDKAWPDRPKAADGMVASAAHHKQNPDSDHESENPHHRGVVTAWDITTDPRFTDTLAEWLRAHAATDRRTKYLIYKGRIASSKQGWAWRPYSGFSKHFDHIHLSVSDDPKQYDRTDPWGAFTHPAKPKPLPHVHPFHAGMVPHHSYPDIADIRARFRLPNPPQGAAFFDDQLSAHLVAFAKSRGITYNRLAITAELWKEVWR